MEAIADSEAHDSSVLVLTKGFIPALGSAIDALAEEVTWRVWEMKAASPRSIQTNVGVGNVISSFNQLVETVWEPGKILISTELAAFTEAHQEGLRFRLLIGAFGPKGSTQHDSAAIGRIVDAIFARSTSPYDIELVDPSLMLSAIPADEISHTALIRQREVEIELGEETFNVLSRWQRTVDGWMAAALLCLANPGVPTRVRATVLATQLGVDDRLALDRALDRVQALRDRGRHRPDYDLQLDRVAVTLADLRASFSTPLLTAEIAVASADPLALPTLRAIATAFTSEADVRRGSGVVTVAGSRALLGGFEILRQPNGLAGALKSGLPLNGGIGPRSMSELTTLTESPIAWAIPAGGPIPTIPTTKTTYLPVPPSLRSGLYVGTGLGGAEVRVPEQLVGQHVAILGKTGCGKSALLSARALAALRSQGESPFVLIDPHGPVADRVMAVAEAEAIPVCLLDAFDIASSAISPIPPLDGKTVMLEDVGRAAGRLADAIMSSLPDVQWAGPRWRQQALVIAYLMAGLGIGLDEAIAAYSNATHRLTLRSDRRVPEFAIRILALLDSDPHAGELVGWVTAKLDGLVSGPAGRLLAPPGKGFKVEEVIKDGHSLVVNLAGLPRGDSALLGHLVLSAVLDVLMDIPKLPWRYDILVDEAPLFPVAGLEHMIHAGRKYNARLWLAAQSLEQCGGTLADAIGATSVQFAFRQTPDSASHIASLFDVPAFQLLDLPDFHALLKAGDALTSVDVAKYEEVPQREKVAPARIATIPAETDTKEEVSSGESTSSSDSKQSSGGPLLWQFRQALRDRAKSSASL